MLPSRRGMNLLEITIVLLVIGLIAAITTPQVTKTLEVTQLNAAAVRVGTTLSHVRSVAMNEGRTTTIQFDPANDVVFTTDVSSYDKLGTPISIALKTEYGSTIELAANFDGVTTLSFDLEGNPVVSGNAMQSGVVTLTAGSQSTEIYVLAGTGLISFTAPVVSNDGGYP